MRKPLVALIVVVCVGWHATPACCAPQDDSPQERLAHGLRDPAIAPPMLRFARSKARGGSTVEQDHAGGRDVAPFGAGVQGPRAVPVGLHGTLTIQMVPRDGAQAVDYALQYLRPLATAQSAVMIQHRLWGDAGWRHLEAVSAPAPRRISGHSQAHGATHVRLLGRGLRAVIITGLLPRVRAVAGRAILAADSMLASERARDPAPRDLLQRRSNVPPHREVMPAVHAGGRFWARRLLAANGWSDRVDERVVSRARSSPRWRWHGVWAAWLQGRGPPLLASPSADTNCCRLPGEMVAVSGGMLHKAHRAFLCLSLLKRSHKILMDFIQVSALR